ncbi:MAG TPA: two-component regulator propeller domain-containing protein [candidate division Zixibacteria bacterium]|nr:two-component regulator propeller domain-containing protein [candidate division Zixibacteria bacterium]
MKRLANYALIFGVLWLAACSKNDTTPPPTQSDDTTPPADISNLVAGSPTGSTITLSWTAPGDDGIAAKASQYDIRYSTSLITDSNFNQATQVANPPLPTVGGANQTFIVGSLQPNTLYYFGIKTADEVPNWSGLSNIDSAKTLLAGDWTVFTAATTNIPSDTVYDIDFHGSNRLVGTSGGLGILTGSTWTTFDSLHWPNLPEDRIRAVAYDPAGKIWAASYDYGFSGFEDTAFVLYNDSTTGQSVNAVRTMISNSVGELWIGTANAGLFHFTDTGLVNYTTLSGVNLNQNGFTDLAFDSSGFLWVAYGNGRVARFNGTTFDNPIDVGSQYNIVHSIAADRSGNLWFGSDIGVFRYNSGNLVQYTTSNSGLVYDVIISVAVTPNEEKWFGTPVGLSRFNGSTWTTYTTSNSNIPDNFTWIVRSDQVGNVWIGTNHGLAEFTP